MPSQINNTNNRHARTIPHADFCDLAFCRAACNARNIKLLHYDIQDYDRNGNQQAAGTETRKHCVLQLSIKPTLDTDSYGEIIRTAKPHKYIRKNKVAPRTDKVSQNGINDNRLTQRNNHLPEYAILRRAVNARRLVYRHRYRIEKSLYDIVPRARRQRVRKRKPEDVVGKIELTENIIQRNHRQKAGEQSQNQADIHKLFARAETHSRQRKRHHQNKHRRNSARDKRDYKSVNKPSAVRIIGILEQQFKVVKRVRLGEYADRRYARVGIERF